MGLVFGLGRHGAWRSCWIGVSADEVAYLLKHINGRRLDTALLGLAWRDELTVVAIESVIASQAAHFVASGTSFRDSTGMSRSIIEERHILNHPADRGQLQRRQRRWSKVGGVVSKR